MATASSSSSSYDFSKTIYSKIDFTRLKNILPSSPKIVAINPSSDLIREDDTDDSKFYNIPRFVHHIDDRARYVLSQFYTYVVKQTKETMILDLCSSWTSHLPENIVGLVHGLGMNESELKYNPSLSNGYTVQNLNTNPSLTQFPSNSFDSVLCSVSVDYLIYPLEVFNEIGRILKPSGQFITSFSNRCFPTKVIGRWMKMNEQQRVEWVANYFLLTNTYFDPKTVKAYSFFDNMFLPARYGEFRDPMYIVLGQKKTA
ncbi:unnamed protein product [Rotaria sp. Silwood1]|nr:unnamed protein product [Rotaria sp. Silwood1]CAF3632969.1 unnamed protein product [Rotaria sp. Silwood1]CAF3704893.1 unnamed protein product [Rotaria sp. Silwood1]CAF4935262.1 unnamed protein product [Rotaria sp. Silwood1]CAF4970294.1 unnamed protein product [Rotaria sp. Silwood1]